MFKKILIANRGEIALRILRACHTLGIQTVVVHSLADTEANYVKMANESVCIGPAAATDSYLNIPAIISAAEITDVDAIHPGYGFLAENPDFVERVETSGFIFIGPPAHVVKAMGDKLSARLIAQQNGLFCIPGSEKALPKSEINILKIADNIGYPIMLKSVGGGGGRGMRVVHNKNNLLTAIAMTQEEAYKAFHDKRLYLEQFLETPRHIEVQVLADNYGHVICIGDRDCSLQRKHQKVIEEAPAPDLNFNVRQDVYQKCRKICQKIGYRGAGTFEFLYQNEQLYFIEMNTRLQVEHTVTESITGIDLVEQQILIAAGDVLNIQQEDIIIQGHAIQCRINAEDPIRFTPSPGTVQLYHPPGGPGIRMDSHIYQGYTVPPYYDSMIGKLIAHGTTRKQAIARMKVALQELIIEGIKTNIPLHQKLLHDRQFMEHPVHINYLRNLLK